MKIVVVGAGAIGGLLGGACAEAGHEVSLVARGAHLDALRRSGLTVRWLDRGERRYELRATDQPGELGVQDAVIIALKAHSIAPMLPRLRPILGEDTPVVTAINGLPWWYFQRHGGPLEGTRIECLDRDGAMVKAVDPRHLVGCVVHSGGEVIEPGVVLHSGGRMHYLGELDGSTTPRVQALAQAITAGGLEAAISPNIRNDIWMKLIGNLSYNPVAALSLVRMDEINANPGLIRMIRTQMQEAMAVASAYGQTIAMSIDQRLALARTMGRTKVSMHQDLERGRPLEIDAIVGAVLELGRKAGVAMPMVDAVYSLIAARVRHREQGC